MYCKLLEIYLIQEVQYSRKGGVRIGSLFVEGNPESYNTPHPYASMIIHCTPKRWTGMYCWTEYLAHGMDSDDKPGARRALLTEFSDMTSSPCGKEH